MCFVVAPLKAQPDTVIVYNIASRSIDTILPAAAPTTATFAKTGSFTGSLGNKVALSLNPPTSNLFSGSNFCDITKASDHFNTSSYPARTAVALRYYRRGRMETGCSGIMVSPYVVLTASHCVYDAFSQSFSMSDSLKISPAFDNGSDQPGIPFSLAKRVYIFKTFYDKTFKNDIALIELKEPIGLQTGWVGIAYDSNPSYYLSKVFHKFSYPGDTNRYQPNRIYNGDTLYYNYGYIDTFPSFLGINSPAAFGVGGQSGSSFLFTDNTEYYSVGVFNYSSHYLHCPINKEIYYQFENILSRYATNIETKGPDKPAIKIYPNPFGDMIFIEPPNELQTISFSLFNNLGQLIETGSFSSQQKMEINTTFLEKGIYFLQIHATGNITTTKCVKN